MDDEAAEIARPLLLPGGRQPTAAEVEEHVATGHASHRSWCSACMRARGLAGPHQLQEAPREDADPKVCLDYATMGPEAPDGDELAADAMQLLVVKDCRTKLYRATAVAEKGAF